MSPPRAAAGVRGQGGAPAALTDGKRRFFRERSRCRQRSPRGHPGIRQPHPAHHAREQRSPRSRGSVPCMSGAELGCAPPPREQRCVSTRGLRDQVGSRPATHLPLRKHLTDGRTDARRTTPNECRMSGRSVQFCKTAPEGTPCDSRAPPPTLPTAEGSPPLTPALACPTPTHSPQGRGCHAPYLPARIHAWCSCGATRAGSFPHCDCVQRSNGARAPPAHARARPG